MFTSEETHALKVYELYELLLKLPSDVHDELFKRITSLANSENND